MKRFFSRQSPKIHTVRAQAMVEFMLVLPILLMLIYGIIEVGRLIFIFASVANASRQAARYGSASGEVNDTAFYQDCDGIRAVANQSAFIITFDEINITYDRGINPDGTSMPIEGVDPNPQEDACPIEVPVRNGDRIIVQVSTTYEPILTLLPVEPMEVVSASARSFLISIPIVGNALPTGFAPETATPSIEPTIISPTPLTPTSTITSTATYIPTSPNMPRVTPANTQPPPATFTATNTALPTYTPTFTATPISCTGLTGVSHGPLVTRDSLMEMSIDNQTGHMLTVAQIYVEWNNNTGHDGPDSSLRLRQITLDSDVWDGNLRGPSAYIPSFYPSIPQGASIIRFRFHQTYDLRNGTERIIVTISNPGCINYPVDSSH